MLKYCKEIWARLCSWYLISPPWSPDLGPLDVGPLTRLEILPVELIGLIRSWLPLHSTASLSLCSRRLHAVLGTEIFANLNASESELSRFLQALDRDLQETLYCFICNRLHVLFQRCGPTISTRKRFRRVTDGRCGKSDGFYNYLTAQMYGTNLKLEHVQMAIKLHRRKQLSEANAYLAYLSSTKPVVGRMTILPIYQGLRLFESRFLDDQIYLRVQTWLWITAVQDSQIPMWHYAQICVHLDANSSNRNAYKKAIQCRFKHLFEARQDCNRCHDLIRCPFCPTEVIIETKCSSVDPQGAFLISTKWQVLGSGFLRWERSLKGHLEIAEAPLWGATGRPNIRDDFEAQTEIKYDSLLSVVKARKLIV